MKSGRVERQSGIGESLYQNDEFSTQNVDYKTKVPEASHGGAHL